MVDAICGVIYDLISPITPENAVIDSFITPPYWHICINEVVGRVCTICLVFWKVFGVLVAISAVILVVLEFQRLRNGQGPSPGIYKSLRLSINPLGHIQVFRLIVLRNIWN